MKWLVDFFKIIGKKLLSDEGVRIFMTLARRGTNSALIGKALEKLAGGGDPGFVYIGDGFILIDQGRLGMLPKIKEIMRSVDPQLTVVSMAYTPSGDLLICFDKK